MYLLGLVSVANEYDRSKERKVSLDEVHAALYELNQERITEKQATKPNLIRYIECSMLTGSGLRYIYNYLGIPFVQLQVCLLFICSRITLSLLTKSASVHHRSKQ